MASNDFIIELWQKMHPKSKVRHYIDLTEGQRQEVRDRINERHTVSLVHAKASVAIGVDLEDLKAVAIAASNEARKAMQEYEQKPVRELLGPDGDEFDEDDMATWLANYQYHKRRLDAADKIVDKLVTPIIEATNEQSYDFYL